MQLVLTLLEINLNSSAVWERQLVYHGSAKNTKLARVPFSPGSPGSASCSCCGGDSISTGCSAVCVTQVVPVGF